MLCPRCGREMSKVMVFCKNKRYQLYRCKCTYETKPTKYHFTVDNRKVIENE